MNEYGLIQYGILLIKSKLNVNECFMFVLPIVLMYFPGASSGIGTETARVLAMRGVHVIMAVRNIAAGKDVKEAIVKEIPSAKVDAMELDLSSMASVRKFASDYKTQGLPLNLLM